MTPTASDSIDYEPPIIKWSTVRDRVPGADASSTDLWMNQGGVAAVINLFTADHVKALHFAILV